MSLLAELVDRVEEGGAEVGKCDHYRSQLEGVRASLGDSAREALARLVTVVRLAALFKTHQSLGFS